MAALSARCLLAVCCLDLSAAHPCTCRCRNPSSSTSTSTGCSFLSSTLPGLIKFHKGGGRMDTPARLHARLLSVPPKKTQANANPSPLPPPPQKKKGSPPPNPKNLRTLELPYVQQPCLAYSPKYLGSQRCAPPHHSVYPRPPTSR